MTGHRQAHHLVRLAPKLFQCLGSGHGNGEDHLLGPVLPRNLARHGRGRSGGDTVVHDDHRPSGERDPFPSPAVACLSPFQLRPFGFLDPGAVPLSEAGCTDRRSVDQPYAALADGAEGHLGLEGHPEFADHDHVQRCAQGARDLRGHGYSAAGEPEYHWLDQPEPGQLTGQLSASGRSIGEEHTAPPFTAPIRRQASAETPAGGPGRNQAVSVAGQAAVVRGSSSGAPTTCASRAVGHATEPLTSGSYRCTKSASGWCPRRAVGGPTSWPSRTPRWRPVRWCRRRRSDGAMLEVR